MQIVIESLALAAFGDMLRRTQEPLLRKLLRYVMSDEARHVAFGVLTLSEFYAVAEPAELRERQEFLLDNTLRNRSRATTPEVWERMGVVGGGGGAVHHGGGRAGQDQPGRWVRPGVLRQAGPERAQARVCWRPTTATCARSGARPDCSSSSSPTTPGRTTRPTTPWLRIGRWRRRRRRRRGRGRRGRRRGGRRRRDFRGLTVV